jgi:predicted nucleic acid-binding protein
MPDLVINTGPIIALTAALGSLQILDKLYENALVPLEVYSELLAGGKNCPEVAALANLKSTCIAAKSVEIPDYLIAVLDSGEASVIQSASLENVTTVAIDEKKGRRIARLHGLKVTGSVGILVKAFQKGYISNVDECFERMRTNGIWISKEIIEQAIRKI